MRRFVLEQNIKRFELALSGLLPDDERELLTRLLQEAERDLKVLDMGRDRRAAKP